MHRTVKTLIGTGIVIIFSMMFFASTAPKSTYKTNTNPGFYGVTTWWNNGSNDVNGEVGHRLYVDGPRAKCIECKNCSAGSWTSNWMIVSGSFPPGLSWGDAASISGIPTERGHWIVKVKLYNIKCNGGDYDACCSFSQELRFHITGTGRVNN